MNDNLLQSDPTTMLAQAGGADAIVGWDDAKKKDFITLFKDRVHAARYILLGTARKVAHSAQQRKFISQKHMRPLENKWGHNFHNLDAPYEGERDRSELNRVVEERCAEIIKQLPPLKTAVQWIDAEVAQMIERCDKLKKEAQKYADELDDVCEEINMADLDQKMTIGDFRAMVKAKDKKRKELLNKIQEAGKEGSELEITIAKRLYAGLPGLSDAVIENITSHLERVQALGEMARRIEEQVRFGDSEAAMEILRTFEKDEVTVSTEFKAQIKGAVEILKAKGKALVAARKGGKKATKKATKKGK